VLATPNCPSCSHLVSCHCSLSGDLPEQTWDWPRTKSTDTPYCFPSEYGSAAECFFCVCVCVRRVVAFLAEGSAQPRRDQTLMSSQGRSSCGK